MLQRIGIFRKPTPIEYTGPLTRFQKAAELKGVAMSLKALRDKWIEVKKAGDEKGAHSNEFRVAVILEHHLNLADEEINKFNQKPTPLDHFLDIKDMIAFTDRLKPKVNLSSNEKEILNSMMNDKPYLRNASLTLLVLSLPVAPWLMFGAGIAAAAWGLTGLFLMKPTAEFFKSIKAIDDDTESKTLLENYLNTVTKSNENLSKYIEENQASHAQQLESTKSLRPA